MYLITANSNSQIHESQITLRPSTSRRGSRGCSTPMNDGQLQELHAYELGARRTATFGECRHRPDRDCASPRTSMSVAGKIKGASFILNMNTVFYSTRHSLNDLQTYSLPRILILHDCLSNWVCVLLSVHVRSLHALNHIPHYIVAREDSHSFSDYVAR